ncbi:MAG: PHP domain-containing protein [Lachnospiraceae bacterium]
MKTELHAHTSQTSPCSNISAGRLVKMYEEKGYDAVVITDHYSKWVMEHNNIINPQEFTEFFLNGYKCALKYSQENECHIKVFPGAEVNLLESPNDYLLYGADTEFFLNNPLLFKMSLKKLYKLCQKNGILLVQAHPCRAYCTPADVCFLDGAEVYNGNMRHNSNNEKTFKWAEKNHLVMTSGSDFHEEEDLARGGIITEEDFNSVKELARILKKGNYSLIQI